MQRRIVEDDLVVAVAHIATDLAHLPAAPTPDWCERAALALTRHRPDTQAWVLVVGESETRWPRQVESRGFAAGALAAAHPDADRLGTALVRMACAAGAEAGWVMSVDELLGLLDARPRGTGLVVEQPHLVVGVARLGGGSGGDAALCPRALVVGWDWPPCRAGEDAGSHLALASLLPVVRDRLRQALGTNGNPWLSVCEHRVLAMLTEGRSVPEIAEALGRSPHTVHDHVKRLNAKLGTRGRGALLVRVLGYKPLPPSPAAQRPARRARSAPPCRQGVYVDHRSW